MLKKLFTGKADRGIVQLFRYGLVVGIAAPIDLGGYVFLKEVANFHYIAAATTSFTVSLIVNYILSVKWVWTAKTGRQRHVEAAIFAIIGLVGLLLTDLIVWLFTDFYSLNYIISKLIAFTIVFCWSFGSRRYLFQRRLQAS